MNIDVEVYTYIIITSEDNKKYIPLSYIILMLIAKIVDKNKILLAISPNHSATANEIKVKEANVIRKITFKSKKTYLIRDSC